jgi:hypothetical protein
MLPARRCPWTGPSISRLGFYQRRAGQLVVYPNKRVHTNAGPAVGGAQSPAQSIYPPHALPQGHWRGEGGGTSAISEPICREERPSGFGGERRNSRGGRAPHRQVAPGSVHAYYNLIR